MSSSALHDSTGGFNRRVEYFYDPDIGNYYYGSGHPMKPHRVRLTHHLLLNYGLYRQMNVFRPLKATKEEMSMFHKSDYLDFLRICTPDEEERYANQMERFNVGQADCPIFGDLYEYCQVYSGASLSAAMRLNAKRSDIVVNWSGGMHHAKKSEASGFCYVNDIVLAILELLKSKERVLYLDIDIHHGDGVEEAFYSTNRVMTLSFHQYGDFFPGTGTVQDDGNKDGKGYALNFPLQDGLTNQSFRTVFRPVIDEVMARFRPEAVVMCCGADSITGDRLGCWNLTIKGHAECIDYVKGFGVPLMLLGGGGYTPRNVARCWAWETSVALGKTDMLDDELPFNDYYEFFKPEGYKLHLPPQKNIENFNSTKELQNTLQKVLSILYKLESAPSVPIYTGNIGTTQIPKAAQDLDEREKIRNENVDAEVRTTAAFEGRKASNLDAIAPESRVESDLNSNNDGSSNNNNSVMEEGVTAWKVAPKEEEDEEGL